jgi:hypothetical protein
LNSGRVPAREDQEEEEIVLKIVYFEIRETQFKSSLVTSSQRGSTAEPQQSHSRATAREKYLRQRGRNSPNFFRIRGVGESPSRINRGSHGVAI